MSFDLPKFNQDIQSLSTNIEGIIKNPDKEKIKSSMSRIDKILTNNAYNQSPSVTNAFNALKELNRELDTLEGAFTYGGKITKEELALVGMLMKKTETALPAPDTTDMLLWKSRMALSEHRYDEAVAFASSIPIQSTRDDRLQGLVLSYLDQREKFVKEGHAPDFNAASRKCFEIAAKITDVPARTFALNKVLDKLVTDASKNLPLIGMVIQQLPATEHPDLRLKQLNLHDLALTLFKQREDLVKNGDQPDITQATKLCFDVAVRIGSEALRKSTLEKLLENFPADSAHLQIYPVEVLLLLIDQTPKEDISPELKIEFIKRFVPPQQFEAFVKQHPNDQIGSEEFAFHF